MRSSVRTVPLLRNLSFAAGLLSAAFLLGGCNAKEEHSAEAKESAGAEAHAEPRVKQSTNGQPMLVLDTDTQKRMGLETRQLEPGSAAPANIAYGRVLDFTPLVALVTERETARAALRASESELNRLKTLSPAGNASERALQAAQATTARDEVQLQSVDLRLLTAWGPVISERQDLPEFVKSLASRSNALVELSLPAGEALPGAPLSAQVTAIGETNAVEAQPIGPATVVDPSLQGRSFRFLVRDAERFVPGRAVCGLILFPGKPLNGALLPDSAILRHEGQAWVYVRTGDDTFERRGVELVRRLSGGWLVESLKPGTTVVTTGAQQMLSEELKGQGGEE